MNWIFILKNNYSIQSNNFLKLGCCLTLNLFQIYFYIWLFFISTIWIEGISTCVSLGSKPQRWEKENPVQIDFIYWDQDFDV